jgi:hypothetical protein
MTMFLTRIRSATYPTDITFKNYVVKNLKDISVLFPVTEMINNSHMKIKHIEYIFMKILLTEDPPPPLRFIAVSLSEQILMCGRHYDPSKCCRLLL